MNLYQKNLYPDFKPYLHISNKSIEVSNKKNLNYAGSKALLGITDSQSRHKVKVSLLCNSKYETQYHLMY